MKLRKGKHPILSGFYYSVLWLASIIVTCFGKKVTFLNKEKDLPQVAADRELYLCRRIGLFLVRPSKKIVHTDTVKICQLHKSLYGVVQDADFVL